MKTSLSLFKSPILCIGLVLAAAASSAIAGSMSTSYPSNFGNTNLGYASTYTVGGSNASTGASLSIAGNSSATLLGTSKPLSAISISNKVAGGVPSASVSVVIGSYIVYSETDTATTTWNKTVSQTFVTANSTVNVPTGSVAVPVSVSATLAGSGGIAMTSSLSKTSVGLSGNVGTTVNGTASATVASKYNASVALTANLNYGKALLNANSAMASASTATTSLIGNYTLSLDAANLAFIVQLNSIATSAAAKTTLLGSTTLGSFVLPARTFTLLSL